MKLYTTLPYILTLVTWVPQVKLAFGQTLCFIVRPSATTPSCPTVFVIYISLCKTK